MPPIVISLCDLTGNAVRPWARVGYECWCIDLQHPGDGSTDEPNIRKIREDVTVWELPANGDIAFAFAFPPCTDLAVSGARWFPGKGLLRLAEAIRVVGHCQRLCEASGAPWILENPVSVLASHWRKPDFYFHPHEYAGYLQNSSEELYTKKTCLWGGGGFVMPPQLSLPPTLGSKMHLLPPSANRDNLRSVTPIGFSQALFLANRRRI